MKQTEIVKDESGQIDLVRTWSTTRNKLKQTDTNKTYGFSVVDAIIGYDRNNIPLIGHTYEETDEIDIIQEETVDGEL